MKHSCLYLFGLAHVPEVLAQITAGSSGNIHLATLWTFPFAVIVDEDLTIVSTYMTVVRLGVELSILYVVVYISYDLCQSIQVVAHVWYLNI